MTDAEHRDLDRRIAIEVMGDVYDAAHNVWTSRGGSDISCADDGPKRYSTDMNTAWEVVELLAARGYGMQLEDWRNLPSAPGKWSVWFDTPSDHTTGTSTGETAAEAICVAALKEYAKGDTPTVVEGKL